MAAARKPAHHLDLIRDLAEEVRQAQARLHLVVEESLALGSPYRTVAAAAGMSYRTLHRWHRKPGATRSRWPGRPDIAV